MSINNIYIYISKFLRVVAFAIQVVLYPGDLNDFGNRLLPIEEKHELIRIPNTKEIKEAIWTFHLLKSLGSYGYSRIFYRTYWNILQENFFNFVKECFLLRDIPLTVNQMSIVLIPKVKNLTSFNHLNLSVFATLTTKLLLKFWQPDSAKFSINLSPPIKGLLLRVIGLLKTQSLPRKSSTKLNTTKAKMESCFTNLISRKLMTKLNGVFLIKL